MGNPAAGGVGIARAAQAEPARAKRAQKLDLVAQATAFARLKTRSSKAVTSESQTGIAISGQTAYRALLKVKFVPRANGGDSELLSASIVATDLVTGLERRLMQRRHSVFFGLATGPGHTYGVLYRIVSERRQRLRVQLIDFGDFTGPPREIYSEPVNLEQLTCQPLRLVGVTPAGEAMVVQPIPGAGCAYDDYEGGNADAARLTAFGPDGGRREMLPRVNIMSPVAQRGERLLYAAGDRVRVMDLATGASQDRWTGPFASIDMSAAGDMQVAWVASPYDFAGDEMIFWFYAGGTAKHTGHTADDDSSKSTFGLLTLPADPAAAPQVPVADSQAEISTTVRCGSGWVRFVAAARSNRYVNHLPPLLTELFVAPDGTWQMNLRGSIGVELRADDGSFVRTLGALRTNGIYQPVCNAGIVTVPYEPVRRPTSDSKPSFGIFDAN